MAPQVSPRAAVATFSAAAVAVLVILVWFVGPGAFVITHCNPASVSNESVNGRTYCYTVVPIPPSYANYTLWGFVFHLTASSPLPPGSPTFNFTITEPNGTSYSGNLSGKFIPPPGWVRPPRFTPDNESGVKLGPGSGTASLLVESGY